MSDNVIIHSALADRRHNPEKRALERLAMPDSQLLAMERQKRSPVMLKSPRSRVISASVRRCLFGVSEPEDTENLYKFVIEDACAKFVENYDFDPREYQPVDSDAPRFEWEKVDEDNWRATHLGGVPQKTSLDPSRPIRSHPPPTHTTSSTSSPRANDVKGSQAGHVGEYANKKTCGSLKSSSGFKKPLMPLKTVNGGSHSFGNSRQTLLSDYMTPRKRKLETSTKSASIGLKMKETSTTKRAKIMDFLKPTA